MLIVACPVVAGTAVNGDAQDALALVQVVEARVYQSVTVVLAASLCFSQSLSLGKRQLIELLLALRCGDVDGIGYAVANGQQVAVVASGINAHDCSIAAGTGTDGDALFISYTRCVLKIHTVCTKGTHGVYEMNIGRA